ncbi:MAG: M48 family metallopeptidase [Burkholderiales bacterium]|nr:M48 family metallopeptidase [Burkholderiales bacterium]
MTAAVFTAVFVAALAVSLAVRLWLAGRQVGFVRAHREAVPAAFAARIGLAAHRKAADYTVARQRLAILHAVVDAAVLLAMTLGGGLAAIVAWTETLAIGPLWRDVAMFAVAGVIVGLASLPFSWWHTFVIEERFGFNRMTLALWVTDLGKGLAVAIVLGLPLLVLVLWLMRAAGPWWWLWAWGAWMAFQLLVLVLYPTLIAPLFNKFTPLADSAARERVEALLTRCGVRSAGLFVMDGSRRSGHGNAYFTGFGKAKRIVFFDTLLSRLAPDEIEAVLAHELGHFKLRHVTKRIAWSALLSLAILALLAWLAAAPWFYVGLGIPESMLPVAMARPGVALELFLLALPVFTFALEPLSSMYSRRHEFEADAFATRHASATALTVALVKLYEDNAATLTPDPLHSAFYDSHPPAAVRIARIASLAA